LEWNLDPDYFSICPDICDQLVGKDIPLGAIQNQKPGFK
jgi:hypothetical protein